MRVWVFRAALIGAAVGAAAAFLIVTASFWLDPPGPDPDAETLWEQVRLAGALALSGGYAGAMAGLIIGFVHGVATAWATTRGWLPIDDLAMHHRGVRIIGAVVIFGVVGVGYAAAAALGVVGGADGWLLGATAGVAAVVSAAYTPSIVARYAPGHDT